MKKYFTYLNPQLSFSGATLVISLRTSMNVINTTYKFKSTMYIVVRSCEVRRERHSSETPYIARGDTRSIWNSIRLPFLADALASSRDARFFTSTAHKLSSTSMEASSLTVCAIVLPNHAITMSSILTRVKNSNQAQLYEGHKVQAQFQVPQTSKATPATAAAEVSAGLGQSRLG